jgi:hypothetical protein
MNSELGSLILLTIEKPMPQVFLGLMAFFMVIFLCLFLVPSLKQLMRLKGIKTSLDALSQQGEVRDLEQVAAIFVPYERHSHIWSEYTESLHSQTIIIDGEEQIAAIRSTVPAEAFFKGLS